jgi:uncharacterized RDD family membrane protein YckC
MSKNMTESEALAWPVRASGQASGSTGDWPGPEGIACGSSSPPDPNRMGAIAGFFIRGIAFFMDLFILNVLFLILVMVGNLAMKSALQNLYLESSSDELIQFLLGLYPFMWFFLFLTYFTFFMAYGGQTPAKMLLRIKVLTKDQQPLTWGKAFLRTIGYFISGGLLLGLGFLVLIFHPQKRAFHDLLAETLVMKDVSHS